VAYGENLTSSNIEQTDYSDEALHYVYQQADKTDRDIIEMKTGYGGKYQPMVPKQIAQVLNLTPVQLARRSARLAMRVNEARENLTDIIE
jgi:hypothetical protein